jgi:uncharacterized membrane protein HdeD (DUF308 family)
MATATPTLERPAVAWWVVLIGGVAMAIAGTLLLLSPGMTTAVLIEILGIYWLINGVVSLVRIFVDRSGWGRKLAVGVLGIVAGFIVLRHPLWSTALVPGTLIVLLGFVGIAVGVLEVVESMRGGGWGPAVLGVASALFGLLLVFNPVPFLVALPVLIGVLAGSAGVIAVIIALAMRSDQADRARRDGLSIARSAN